jgi:hypothetical protein
MYWATQHVHTHLGWPTFGMARWELARRSWSARRQRQPRPCRCHDRWLAPRQTLFIILYRSIRLEKNIVYGAKYQGAIAVESRGSTTRAARELLTFARPSPDSQQTMHTAVMGRGQLPSSRGRGTALPRMARGGNMNRTFAFAARSRQSSARSAISALDTTLLTAGILWGFASLASHDGQDGPEMTAAFAVLQRLPARDAAASRIKL